MKNIILIILIIAAGGIAVYFWYSYSGSQPVAPVERASDSRSAEEKELLEILKVLQAIKIDTGYLDTPVFKELVDFSPPITEPSSKGRSNPFLPASASSVNVAAPVKSE